MPSDQCDGHADGRVHGGQELRAALTGLAKISAFWVDLFNNIPPTGWNRGSSGSYSQIAKFRSRAKEIIPTNWLKSWLINFIHAMEAVINSSKP